MVNRRWSAAVPKADFGRLRSCHVTFSNPSLFCQRWDGEWPLEGWEGVMAGPDIRGCSEAAARQFVQAQANWIEEPVHFETNRPRLAIREAFIYDNHLGTA